MTETNTPAQFARPKNIELRVPDKTLIIPPLVVDYSEADQQAIDSLDDAISKDQHIWCTAIAVFEDGTKVTMEAVHGDSCDVREVVQTALHNAAQVVLDTSAAQIPRWGDERKKAREAAKEAAAHD